MRVVEKRFCFPRGSSYDIVENHESDITNNICASKPINGNNQNIQDYMEIIEIIEIGAGMTDNTDTNQYQALLGTYFIH